VPSGAVKSKKNNDNPKEDDDDLVLDGDGQVNGHCVPQGDLEAAASWSGDPGQGNRSVYVLLDGPKTAQ